MSMNGHDTQPNPLDLAHHFSRSSTKRTRNQLKEYYKFLRTNGMTNFAGGLPDPANFPLKSLELSVLSPGSLFVQSNREPNLKVNVAWQSTDRNPVHRIDLQTCLQYSDAQGYPPLAAWLRKLTHVYHPNIPYKGGASVLINGGSADGLAKVYELLYNAWDESINDIQDREGLIVEEFVYCPPLSQLRPKDANIVTVGMDEQGMRAHGPGSLFDVLENWNPAHGKRPHVVYLIPTGQNPTSAVMSYKRRKEIYEICSRFDLFIIEDDPYWTLYYPSVQSISLKYKGVRALADFPTDPYHNYSTHTLEGHSTGFQFLDELIPSFLSIDTDGRVIRLDSFSKTIAPGLRLGWTTAQPDVIEQLIRVTHGTTQPPAGLTQAIVTQLLADFNTLDHLKLTTNGSTQASTIWGSKGWVDWLEDLRNVYQRRMVTMATIFEENKSITLNGTSTELFTFTWPMGGMFLWMKVNITSHPLATHVDPSRLMLAFWIFCTQQPYQILTVPGGDFAASPAIKQSQGYMYLRFCFAAVEEGILKAKSYAFVQACRDFWEVKDTETIEKILEGEGITGSVNLAAPEFDQVDREDIVKW